MKRMIQKLVGMGVDLSTKKALKSAMRMLGVKPENVDRLYIELQNSIHEEAFRKASPKNKLVLLPQCLRRCSKCRAKLGKFGYECVGCSEECKARQIKERAEKLGYRVFIVPGGSMVSKIVRDIRPEAVLGVACKHELAMALNELSVPAQAVELLKDGCIDTDVDLEEVMGRLQTGKNHHATVQPLNNTRR